MSTRSVIAVAAGDGWHGRYTHFDGYPTEAGKEWWCVFHTYADLTSFEAAIITAHPGGYRQAGGECYCHDVGDDPNGCMYTDRDEKEEALMLEWVYVFGRRVLTIYTNEPTGEEQRCENSVGRWWMEPCYRWVVVCQVPLDGPEPDWQVIEDAASTNPPTPVALALAHRI
jgi:hypothetical protein